MNRLRIFQFVPIEHTNICISICISIASVWQFRTTFVRSIYLFFFSICTLKIYTWKSNTLMLQYFLKTDRIKSVISESDRLSSNPIGDFWIVTSLLLQKKIWIGWKRIKNKEKKIINQRTRSMKEISRFERKIWRRVYVPSVIFIDVIER